MLCSFRQYQIASVLATLGLTASIMTGSPGSCMLFGVLMVVLCASQIKILNDAREELAGSIV